MEEKKGIYYKYNVISKKHYTKSLQKKKQHFSETAPLKNLFSSTTAIWRGAAA